MRDGAGAPRILIVAYDFPPHAAIGTMRTLRLVRHLQAMGWRVSVLTGSPESYLPGTPVDRALEARVPGEVCVLRANAFRAFDTLTRVLRRRRGSAEAASAGPAGHRGGERPGGREPARVQGLAHRLKDWIDLVLSIPDKESGWIAPAAARGIWHMLASGRPDVIYSSAPPWSVQVVAWILARASGRPWVADFRDPWARAPGREWRQPFRQRAAAMLERAVVLRAQAVLFVTRANLAEFSDVHGAAQARRFHLVPNGCDPSEFDRGTGRPAATPFVLLHAGSFYGPRNPLAIIHALARVIDRRLLDRKEFRLRLLGTVSLSTDLSEECRRLGVADVVEVVPRVSRAESLQALQAASALLLVQTGTTMSIPGKAYEYLAAGRPILALSEEGETAELVRSSGIGVSVSPGDPPEKIDAALLRIASIARASYAPPDVRLYDGRIQAAETARILLRFVPDTRHLPGGTDSMLLGETPPAPGEETGR